MHGIVTGDLAEACCVGSWQVDCAFIVAAKLLPALGTKLPQARTRIYPLRIAADEGLWKNHEIGSLSGGVAREFGKLCDRLRRVEQDRRGLDDGGIDGLARIAIDPTELYYSPRGERRLGYKICELGKTVLQSASVGRDAQRYPDGLDRMSCDGEG